MGKGESLHDIFKSIKIYLTGYESVYPYGDVDDYTDYIKFLSLLKTTFWATVDSVIWSFVNVAIIPVFVSVGLITYPIGLFVYRVKKILGIKKEHSSVNTIDPDIHTNYIKKLKNDGNKLWSEIVENLTKKPSQNSELHPQMDLDLAEFHLHLAALAYEPDKVINKVLNEDLKTLFKIKHDRLGSEGCCILAVWSTDKEKPFVVLAFKGTSPYDLTEWLTDCSIRKEPAANGILPGLIHSGFYSSFGFPKNNYLANTKIGEDKTPWDKILTKLKEIQRGLEPEPTKPPKPMPYLWVTGHSLGAAAATVFTSMMLWRRSPIGKNSPVPNIDWDKKFTLCGTYTFGNPRVGDKDWHDAIESYRHADKDGEYDKYDFYRVINANDIVCNVPLAPQGIIFPLDGISLNDFHHIGLPVKLPYRHGAIVYKDERSPWDVAKNLFKEIIYTPEQLRVGSRLAKSLVLLNFCSGGTIGFTRDHIPSEYLQNLEASADYKNKPKASI